METMIVHFGQISWILFFEIMKKKHFESICSYSKTFCNQMG